MLDNIFGFRFCLWQWQEVFLNKNNDLLRSMIKSSKIGFPSPKKNQSENSDKPYPWLKIALPQRRLAHSMKRIYFLEIGFP